MSAMATVTITITDQAGGVINVFEGVEEFVLGIKRGLSFTCERKLHGSGSELTDMLKVLCVYAPVLRASEQRVGSPLSVLPKNIVVPQVRFDNKKP